MMIDQEFELRSGSTTYTAVPCVDHRCTAACVPKKRRLPPSPSPSSTQEPFSKKLNLHGFTKIPLSITSPPKSPEIYKIKVPTPSPSTEFPARPSPSDGAASINEQRNDSTKLNRMKKIIREISQWCDEFVDDDEEQEAGHKNPKDEFENKREELVSVDRKGDGFIIKLDCSCGKDFQILLSNTKIYYKL